MASPGLRLTWLNFGSGKVPPAQPRQPAHHLCSVPFMGPLCYWTLSLRWMNRISYTWQDYTTDHGTSTWTPGKLKLGHIGRLVDARSPSVDFVLESSQC